MSAVENSSVAVLASSCAAGEASERPAGSENCGADNCSRVLRVTNIPFVSKSPSLHEPFQTGDDVKS